MRHAAPRADEAPSTPPLQSLLSIACAGAFALGAAALGVASIGLVAPAPEPQTVLIAPAERGADAAAADERPFIAPAD